MRIYVAIVEYATILLVILINLDLEDYEGLTSYSAS
jgi:hypothetical protein